MGYVSAAGMAEMTKEGLASMEQALNWHLTANHFPPISTALVPVAMEAIKNANAGNWSQPVAMPEGYRRREIPTGELIEGLHLHAWLEGEA